MKFNANITDIKNWLGKANKTKPKKGETVLSFAVVEKSDHTFVLCSKSEAEHSFQYVFARGGTVVVSRVCWPLLELQEHDGG